MIAKIFTYVILLLVLISCSQHPVKNSIIIEGRIPELASHELQINLNDSIFETVVDNQGKFSLDIPLNNPQYLYVKDLDRNLFLLPNDSLFIEKSENTYKFSGSQSALINNYYTDWKIYLYAVADTSDSERYYNQEPYDFLKSVDKWIEIWKKPLNELQQSNPDLNKDFLALENARIKYWMYGDLNDFKNNNHVIPDSFYQYLNKVNLNDTNLMQLDEYRYFLRSYVYMQVRRLNIKDKILETSRMLDIIEENFKYELVVNEISKEIMRAQTSRFGINDTLLNRFKIINTNTKYVKEIESDYHTLQPLLKGKKAPNFELIGMNNNKVSLESFKGKYLLIDVWSTTCAPCISEIPTMEKLKQELKAKNIEIIAACLSDESAWKTVLAKYGITEGQYRVENGWNSQFGIDYLKSSGVPVYILIDPQGFIVDARAPKPSEKLAELIYSLNI